MTQKLWVYYKKRQMTNNKSAFSAVETPAFQEMFLAHNTTCVYKSRITLRNHIYTDFVEHREKLKIELEYSCITISFTLDIWTAPNRVPIFAIIAHWITPEFDEREEVIEFIELKGSHTGEQLAEIVERTLEELKLKPNKLLALTGQLTRTSASQDFLPREESLDARPREWTMLLHWAMPVFAKLVPKHIPANLSEAFCNPHLDFNDEVESLPCYNGITGDLLFSSSTPGARRVSRRLLRRLLQGIDIRWNKSVKELSQTDNEERLMLTMFLEPMAPHPKCANCC
jgi:hypothetical protein